MASTEELQAQRATLKLKLNMWSAAFVKQNGREPTRGDKARKPAAVAVTQPKHQLTRPHSLCRVETRPT